ncbi:MAG: putative lipid II flippase FtsW [Micromonosporaceae bacterium]
MRYLAREWIADVRGLLDRPLASYYLVLGTSALLLALGLVMVLSSSSVQMLSLGASPYVQFQKQVLGVAFGLPAMWVVSRLRPAVFRLLAYPLMAASVLGLLLVTIKGVGHNGATRWLGIGGFEVQPSECAKLGFALWGADLLARHEQHGQLTEWRHLLVPLMPGAGILGVLVMIGNDLGTTFVLLTIFLALLWIVGTPGRLFIGMLGFVAVVVAILIIGARYRLERITSYLDPQAHAAGSGWQPLQGKYALASGGWFGVGLGASRQKWGMLPDPSTDFIFAILGEELGLAGTLCVVSLFGGLGYAGLRIARRVTDPFARFAATAITGWIVVQALVNIGAVIGLLPITGVPLPLVSAGVSSLIVTMVAIGMLMAMAKHEPGAQEALAARGPGSARRVLSWLGLVNQRREREARL